MKKTLVCVHIMPLEIEMFERFMEQYKRSILYLDDKDDVTLKATLNLNPELIDWSSSELTPDFFIQKFNGLLEDINSIKEVVLDNSLMGTTQQKRESIKLDYDQFIFVDADIAFPEQLLKYQLEASYLLEGKFVLIPNITKLWDHTWDILVHDNFKSEPYGYYKNHSPKLTINQEIEQVGVTTLPVIKFGCGMHTLYTKEFWDFIGIPESFGGYGPEDTFGMFAATKAIEKGYPIKQYLLDGVYITEDYLNRVPTFAGKVKVFDRKQEFRTHAERNFPIELNKFTKTL